LRLPAISATSATAAATVTTTASSATAAAKAASAAFGFRPGFIDIKGTALDLLAVQPRDSGCGFLVRTHFYKTETLCTARFTIHDDLGRYNGSKRCQQRLKTAVVDFIIEISYIQLLTHEDSLKNGFKTKPAAKNLQPMVPSGNEIN
jgi:hypothetical protein